MIGGFKVGAVRIARLKGCFALDKSNEEAVYTVCG
jgi:hypothetical protein